MHPGRVLGAIMGLVILVSFFGLPFYSLNGLTGSGTTLYNGMVALYNNLAYVQSLGNQAAITASYVVLIAAILILIAGIVGYFPLGTGVLGVVGMVMITVAPYLINPGTVSGNIFAGYGIAFYVIWVASIISLGASFWHGKKAQGMGGTVQQQVIVNPASGQSMPPPPPMQSPPQNVVVNPTISVSQSQGAQPSGMQYEAPHPPPPPPSQPGLCPNCGAMNPPTANFCSKCRSSLRR